jgi:SAM-dependent methyltransferase
MSNRNTSQEFTALDRMQYRFLKRFWPFRESEQTPRPPEGALRLEILFGKEFLARIAGKTLIDFGCGPGHEAVEMALSGAKRVIGVDIQEELLREARANASAAGVADCCHFCSSTQERGDMVLSIDAFEHFGDPAAILDQMIRLCKRDGRIVIHFGYTWHHPLGGHLFSVFPWAHLIFSETALCRWRADFKTDGARRFHEVAGGLNQMTIARFERIARSAGLRVVWRRLIPIRAARWLHCRLTREFLTTVAQYELSPPPKA